MKKIMMTLAAVLCCAMTTTVFTACGGDDDDNNTPTPETQADDTTPKKVMMVFSYYATEDMMNYCDIQVTVGNKTEAMTKSNTTKEKIGGAELYVWKQTVASNELPAHFDFSRKVTLKQSIDNVEEFTFTHGKAYDWALYNAAGKQVKKGTPYSKATAQPGPGANVANLINNGNLDDTSTFVFDKDGNMTK